MDHPKKVNAGRVPKKNNKIDLREEFERIAEGKGYLGASDGIPAYAYIRVSSEYQTEEGRTGLPRQLLHVHQVALKGVPDQNIPPLRIDWDMLYADEGFSGFEFKNRPALNALLEEIKDNQQSRYIAMEHIDRLSRQAAWHQGYLLEQIKDAGCTPVFWKAYSSEIERSVLGTISEQGMRQEIQRMSEGQVLKAKSGRITARRARFGYMFVDSNGKPKDKPGSDTHYALHPEKSRVMKWIYHALLYENKTLNEIAKMMNDGTTPVWDGPIPTTFGGCVWHTGTINAMIKAPIYKGEFYAHRYKTIKTGEFNEAGREKVRMVERPRDEWILIEVPPIVTPEEWALAQKRLKQNATRSSRNTKRKEWLLSSLMKCARCGYTYASIVGNTKTNPIRYYGCVSKHQEKAKRDGVACMDRSYVHAEVLEPAIWNEIIEMIMNPRIVTDQIDAEYDDKLADFNHQLEYIEHSLDKLRTEWERWNTAYGTGVIDIDELKQYRNDITRRRKDLEVDRDELKGRIERIESIEDRKAYVEEILGLYRVIVEREGKDPPLKLKRQIMETLVETIWVNDKTKKAQVDGLISTVARNVFGREVLEISFASQSSRR